MEKEAVKAYVEEDSAIYTDEYPSYNVLNEAGYTSESVNHSRGEYGQGRRTYKQLREQGGTRDS